MERIIDEPTYTQGYNHADLLSTFRPELLSDINTAGHEHDDYLLGFHERQQSFINEKLKQEFSSIRNKGKERGYEKDHEKE